tara:strand:- start:114 stop:671 length:558 start_codon:yes stop_codon:yes gene_type:complete
MTDDVDEMFLYGVIALIIAICSNYVGNVLNCKTQKILNDNMSAKHLIILLGIFVSIDALYTANTKEKNKLGKPKRQSPLLTLGMTMSLYFLFLILSKMTQRTTIISSILLIALYYIDLCKDYYEDDSQLLLSVRDALRGILLLTIIFGFLYYFGKQKREKGKNFSSFKFLFGVPVCSNVSELKLE